MKLYFKLFGYLSVIKNEIVQKTLLGLLISCACVLQAIFLSRGIALLLSGAEMKQVFAMTALAGAAILLRAFLIKTNESFVKVLASKIKGKIRIVLIDQVFALGPGYMNQNRSGKVTSLVLDGIESLEGFYVNYIPQVFTTMITGLVVFLYLFRMEPVSAVILLAAMLLCIVIPMISVPLIYSNVTSYWTIYSKLTSQYIDTIQGMTTLKTLGAEETKAEELYGDAQSFYKSSIRNTAVSLADSSVMLTLMGITSGISVVVAAWRCSGGYCEPAAVAAFLFLSVECARPMMDLNRAWHNSFLGLSVAKEMFELIEKKPAVTEKEGALTAGLSKEAPTVAFDNVSFSYREHAAVLKNVSFEIPGGMKAAFAGPSGAGKSTVLNLLLRFYDADEGTIFIGGKDIREYSLEYLRRSIAVVFQDTYLFYGSVLDNIRMAKPEATDEEVTEAAKNAYAHDFIMKLPNGYQTMVGERGTTLSGGQRQRIAIARALLKDAKILLLDEATSSVDAASEQNLQASLTKLSEGRTVIIVAHRLSTIQDADRILVLEEGRLREKGTHDELLQVNGVYSRLIAAQEVTE